ncbi:MAG TPA: hypothetical protein VKD04_09580 [Burkholderiales bacterium]|nr:hypothetical protein [Burkholderiales bacterium]
MNPMLRILVGIVLVASASAGVCADEKAAADAQLAKLREEITALIGPATCANLVNCRVAALGIDPCGGPLEYVAYSWLSTEKAALETKIAEYNFVQEDAQKKSPAVGACVMKPEPVAACVNRRCVVKP